MRAKPKTALTGTPAPVLISSGKAWNERWNSACPSSTARMGLAAGSLAPFADGVWDGFGWLIGSRRLFPQRTSRAGDDRSSSRWWGRVSYSFLAYRTRNAARRAAPLLLRYAADVTGVFTA